VGPGVRIKDNENLIAINKFEPVPFATRVNNLKHSTFVAASHSLIVDPFKTHNAIMPIALEDLICSVEQ